MFTQEWTPRIKNILKSRAWKLCWACMAWAGMIWEMQTTLWNEDWNGIPSNPTPDLRNAPYTCDEGLRGMEMAAKEVEEGIFEWYIDWKIEISEIKFQLFNNEFILALKSRSEFNNLYLWATEELLLMPVRYDDANGHHGNCVFAASKSSKLWHLPFVIYYQFASSTSEWSPSIHP